MDKIVIIAASTSAVAIGKLATHCAGCANELFELVSCLTHSLSKTKTKKVNYFSRESVFLTCKP